MNINTLIERWQGKLNLSNWKISYEFTDFNRPDRYPQKGDIKVNQKDKTATILLKPEQEDTEKTILHELIHLLIWEFDNYSEKNIPKNKKDKYFDLLEKTVKDLTDIIYQPDLRLKKNK